VLASLESVLYGSGYFGPLFLATLQLSLTVRLLFT
jgi:hypothetical protein